MHAQTQTAAEQCRSIHAHQHTLLHARHESWYHLKRDSYWVRVCHEAAFFTIENPPSKIIDFILKAFFTWFYSESWEGIQKICLYMNASVCLQNDWVCLGKARRDSNCCVFPLMWNAPQPATINLLSRNVGGPRIPIKSSRVSDCVCAAYVCSHKWSLKCYSYL